MIVDVDVSYQLLEEIRNSEQPRLHFTRDGGEVHEVFAVGIRPTKPLADVNPLFPGQFLRSDQSCTITDQKWTGVTPEVRVLYHLAVKGRELMPSRTNRREVKDLIDSGKKAGAFNDLSTLYPTARVEYNKLAKSNQLPSMKGERSEVGTTTSPLGGSAEEVDTPMGGGEKAASTLQASPKKIVFLCAYEDEGFRQEIEAHAANLEQQGRLQVFTTSRIPPGGTVEEVVARSIAGADRVVCMVSSHFLSDPKYGRWIKDLTSPKFQWVLVRPVGLWGTKFETTQALAEYGANNSVSTQNGGRDQHWMNILGALLRS
jgi:hypothetical protein